MKQKKIMMKKIEFKTSYIFIIFNFKRIIIISICDCFFYEKMNENFVKFRQKFNFCACAEGSKCEAIPLIDPGEAKERAVDSEKAFRG